MPAPSRRRRATRPTQSRWTLTGITASGQTEELAQRDEYYYAAFSKGGCGKLSAVSNVPRGTLNYLLGDVHDGQPGHECRGDNRVSTEDMSYMTANYGITLAPGDPRACLDIGPTVTGAADSRPLTDDRVDFEDMMILQANFNPVRPCRSTWRSRPDSRRRRRTRSRSRRPTRWRRATSSACACG